MQVSKLTDAKENEKISYLNFKNIYLILLTLERKKIEK